MSTYETATASQIAYRLNDIARLTGLSRRYLERMLAAGEMPKPNLRLRRTSLWHHETVDRWLRGQSQQG